MELTTDKGCLYQLRQTFLHWPIGATALHQLTGAVIVDLLKIFDPLERSVNQEKALFTSGSAFELTRKKISALFLCWVVSINKATYSALNVVSTRGDA